VSEAGGTRHTVEETSVSELAAAFRGLWGALVRRRREFFLVFVTVAVVVQLASFFWPATYVARAAVLIQKNRYSGGLDASGERNPTVTSAGISEQEVNSEIAVLTSREVLEATAAATGIDKIQPSLWLRILFGPIWLYDDLYARWHDAPVPTTKDRAMRSFLHSISVEPMKDSNVLVVSYEAGNPEFAEIVLGNLLENYLKHHVEVHGSPNAESFFESQADTLKADLKQQEDALQELKQSVGAADLGAELGVQQAKVAKLREEQEQLRRSVSELDQRIVSYQGSLRGGAGSMQTTTLEGRNELALQALIQEKLQLELERVRLLERYRADSPLLVENQRKIDAAVAALDNERSGVSQTQSTLSPAAVVASEDLERARAERAGYLERIATLDQQLAAANERLSLLDEKLLEAKRLERLIATNESQYLQYLRRGVEARIDSALDQDQFTNASVVQQATAEAKPIRPKKLMSLVLSLAGGLVAALGTVVVLELRESGLESFVASVAPREAGS
jgi:uncharacterized protein involved in exopolysaccharide biosynthesis